MKENYEFFKKEFQFQGKHAKMVEELWNKDNYSKTFFRRLIDLYILASIIGFRMNRKEVVDTSGNEVKSIFPEQLLREKETLDFIMQMIIMLEASEKESPADCIYKAFRGAETKEDYDCLYKLFNDYVRGGVEELYERLVVRRPELDNIYRDVKTANIMAVVERFSSKR